MAANVARCLPKLSQTVLSRSLTLSKASRAFTTRPAIRALASTPSPLHQRQSSSASRSHFGLVSRTAFHTSSKRPILPAEPQVINGTVNDPAVVPEPSPTHGSYHWAFERLVSIGLVPLTIAPFAAGTLHPISDAILCAVLLVHSHIGFQALVIDYLPNKRIPRIRKLFEWLLRFATISVGVGLYEFETNDVGLTEAIKRVWTA